MLSRPQPTYSPRKTDFSHTSSQFYNWALAPFVASLFFAWGLHIYNTYTWSDVEYMRVWLSERHVHSPTTNRWVLRLRALRLCWARLLRSMKDRSSAEIHVDSATCTLLSCASSTSVGWGGGTAISRWNWGGSQNPHSVTARKTTAKTEVQFITIGEVLAIPHAGGLVPCQNVNTVTPNLVASAPT